jgi:hypothetical protein
MAFMENKMIQRVTDNVTYLNVNSIELGEPKLMISKKALENNRWNIDYTGKYIRFSSIIGSIEYMYVKECNHGKYPDNISYITISGCYIHIVDYYNNKPTCIQYLKNYTLQFDESNDDNFKDIKIISKEAFNKIIKNMFIEIKDNFE